MMMITTMMMVLDIQLIVMMVKIIAVVECSVLPPPFLMNSSRALSSFLAIPSPETKSQSKPKTRNRNEKSMGINSYTGSHFEQTAPYGFGDLSHYQKWEPMKIGT